MARFAWLGVALLTLGCRQEGAPIRFDRMPGEPCSALAKVACSGPEDMLMCVDREWTEVACEEFCILHGLTPSGEGCVVGEWYDWCSCKSTNQTCTDVIAACVSDDVIEVCMAGELSDFDCTDVCAALDPPRSSLGCDSEGWTSDCRCTLEGTSCAATDPTRCDNPVNLASCVDDVWVIEPCADACEPGRMGYCSTSLNGGEVTAECICW